MAQTKVAVFSELDDPEFDDLQLKEPNGDFLINLANNNLPLILPWHRNKTIRLGTCLHSSELKTDDPWSKECPFMLQDLYLTPKVLTRDYGAVASYSSLSTSKTVETQDHLSLGFGVKVSPCIPVCSVTVKGQYDTDVRENKDSDKASVRSSIRAGTVELAKQPKLNTQATVIIKHQGGIKAFKKRYGDYYLAGYKLGGDTGLLISGSGSASKTIENITISVTVEVLWFDYTKSWSKDFEKSTAGRSLKMIGYDTLDGKNWNTSTEVKGPDTAISSAEALRMQAKDVILRSHCLHERVSQILDSLDMHHEDELTMEQCDILTKSGIVVELVLLPVSTIREVVKWKIQDDVI